MCFNYWPDDIGEAYKTLRRLILEYLGMNLSSAEGSLRSGTPDRHSVGSGSCKQDSRPETGSKRYINLHKNGNNPKGSVVSFALDSHYYQIHVLAHILVNKFWIICCCKKIATHFCGVCPQFFRQQPCNEGWTQYSLQYLTILKA